MLSNHHAKWLAIAGATAMFVAGCSLTGSPPPKSPAPVKHVTNATRKTAKTASKDLTKTKTATPKSKGPALKVIAFYDPTMSRVAPDPFQLLKAHPGLVTYLAPFWYEVSATGSIISKPEGNAPQLAAQQHLPLVPLFNNAAGNDGMLATSATRHTAVSNIVHLVTAHNYAGVNIDFQMLKPTDAPLLVKFMNDLKVAMPKGKFISMSVVPLSNANGPSSAYNYSALDKVVNAMVLMAYDLHSNGTAPGPVSPYSWVSQSIARAISAGVSPSKLYLGIANYGYLWTAGSTKAITIPLKVMYQHKYGTYVWNPTYKEAYDTYTSGGVKHIIWFVNDRGAKDRIQLAEKYHLAGVAFWRIGYEDAKWWNVVAKALKTPSNKTSPQSATK